MSEEARSPVPWIRPAMQQDIAWRDGDIVISVPAKSGTTWMMNIVFQLLNGGTADFEGIYDEVPWIEFLDSPSRTPEEVHARLAGMPDDLPRAFKTHSAPPDLPFLRAGSGQNVRYIVICRNPEEALVSLKPFLDQHSDAWYDLWGVPKEAMTRPTFAGFYSDVIDANGMQGMLFGFLAAWWPLRHDPNVLMLHYGDMKQDHEGSIRKVAAFLGIEPPAGRWPAILEYTGFPWMKAHSDRFEPSRKLAVPPLNRGAMIRKGQLGRADEDGMTADIAAHLRTVGRSICPDEAALRWFYGGGPLP